MSQSVQMWKTIGTLLEIKYANYWTGFRTLHMRSSYIDDTNSSLNIKHALLSKMFTENMLGILLKGRNNIFLYLWHLAF